ncbi:hypothetical protein QYG89_06800 [Bacillus sp. B190/17]|uniref:Uncharacterized protein n=1 Tax=Bacillus lumedeiriae TaxID=3058829 RepID=A0ABW8I9Q1_9BACI
MTRGARRCSWTGKAEPTALGRQAYDWLTKWRFSAMQLDWHMTSSPKEAQLDNRKAEAPVLPRQANVLFPMKPLFDFIEKRLFDLEGLGAAAGQEKRSRLLWGDKHMTG